MKHAVAHCVHCSRVPSPAADCIFGKYLTSVLSVFSLLAFFILFNLLVGLLLVGWGDLSLYPGPLNLVQEPGKLSQNEALLRFCLFGVHRNLVAADPGHPGLPHVGAL